MGKTLTVSQLELIDQPAGKSRNAAGQISRKNIARPALSKAKQQEIFD